MHSLGILANCYRHLGRVDFGFSLLGKRLKLVFPPDCVFFNTLINGLIHCDLLPQAVLLLDNIVKKGFQPNLVTYATIVKGLCWIGDNKGALNLQSKTLSGPSNTRLVI